MQRGTKHKRYRRVLKQKSALSLDQFESLATAMIDEIPQRLCKDLNGGFLLLPRAKKDGEFYIMGEYVEDGVMGCSIILYYGSFVGSLENGTREEWEEELKDTILHELRHHLELMAGVDDLAREEMAELEAWKGKNI